MCQILAFASLKDSCAYEKCLKVVIESFRTVVIESLVNSEPERDPISIEMFIHH